MGARPAADVSSSRPADQPYQRRAAKYVSRASSSPERNCGRIPEHTWIRSMTSSRFIASRTAAVTNGYRWSTPSRTASSTARPTAAVTRSIPGSLSVPSGDSSSASNVGSFTACAGSGGAPAETSTTCSWAEFDPMSSAASLIGPEYPAHPPFSPRRTW
jgi:hypothetical protein